jgi:hypothetical protein
VLNEVQSYRYSKADGDKEETKKESVTLPEDEPNDSSKHVGV